MERNAGNVNSTDPLVAMKDDESGVAAIGHRVENARSILALVESALENDEHDGEHFIEDVRNAMAVAIEHLGVAATHAFDLDEIARKPVRK